ncbi:MAG: phosphotransferase family protein [Acidimicrobiia bacterium]|nr:phosphotransferase family protein [Acidimicrobiia bacterium]
MNEPTQGQPGLDIVGIHAAAVGDWYAANIPGARPPLSFELLAGGHSNLTYRVVDAAGTPTVLRRPPTGALLATAHDMAREHKIISGVARGEGVPVPAALGLCQDDSVNDAPFYVMGYVEGVVLDSAETVDATITDAGARASIGRQACEVLASLHAIEPDDVGLGDLGKREDYLGRQIRRWSTQWENSKTRELATMDELSAKLAERKPAQQGAGIVHGDYRLGNMLSTPDGRVAAVLDWELCTLGDPLADVGYIMNNWAMPGEDGPTSRGAAQAPTQAGGFGDRDAFLARYEQLSGRDLSTVPYYRAFQYWRLAAIVEGVMARYLKGQMGAEADTDEFKVQIEALADAGLDMLAQL